MKALIIMVIMLLVRSTVKGFRLDYRGFSTDRVLPHALPGTTWDAPSGRRLVERQKIKGIGDHESKSRLYATSTSQREGAKGSEQDTDDNYDDDDDDDDKEDVYDDDDNGSGLRSSGSPSKRKQAIDIEIAALVAARRPPPKKWIDRQGVVTTVASSSSSQVKIVTYNCLGPLHGTVQTLLLAHVPIPDFHRVPLTSVPTCDTRSGARVVGSRPNVRG